MKMEKMYYRDYRVSSRNIDDFIEFETLLGLINYCSFSGAARDITVNVDGDGSADLAIHLIKGKEKGSLVEVDKKAIKLLEEMKYRRFYGKSKDAEENIKKWTDVEVKEFDEKFQKFQDGDGIRINIGE
jgi:hypothetical protein